MKHSWINAEFAIPGSGVHVLVLMENDVAIIAYYNHSIQKWRTLDEPYELPLPYDVKYWQPIVPPEE